MSVVRGIEFKKEFRCFPQGASIDFEGANFVVILGENGSGKTTLLQAVKNEFKRESFFDRKNEDLKKSCRIVIDDGLDPKKIMAIFLDYLHSNPKNAPHFSEDMDTIMIELQSTRISSGQATQLRIGNRLGKFLMGSTESPSVILFDQPETTLDVGSMTQICFILMMRLIQENKQLFVATHSSDWLKAMYLAHNVVGEEIRSNLSFRFVDLINPTLRIENLEQAVIHNNNKQIEALNDYIEKIAQVAEASKMQAKDRAKAKSKAQTREKPKKTKTKAPDASPEKPKKSE